MQGMSALMPQARKLFFPKADKPDIHINQITLSAQYGKEILAFLFSEAQKL
jgi:hypothetical protein